MPQRHAPQVTGCAPHVEIEQIHSDANSGESYRAMPIVPVIEKNMKTTTFKIEGMNCDGCANTIKTLVESEPGVQMATVSFEEGQARILYDPQSTGEDRLVAVIQKPGFRVAGRY
ncbi:MULTISPECIES: heavy-metal-associated domain-containing protein [unclassified Mesorhizobium]|uniref:heavy-metal-associated domain-containing protein n=2 Tax=unclassified Mesorhizobium TaxID=325217 RepID=UPI001FCABD77|nr:MULTISPECIES: heavy-metal-associated domain-containing protein [unclassified Mesorhizobium]